MQLSDGLSGGAVHDRLDLTQVHVLDPGRPVSGGRQEAAAGPRHEDAGEVAGVVEPGAVQVVLRTARAAAVQLLTHTRAHAELRGLIQPCTKDERYASRSQLVVSMHYLGQSTKTCAFW